MTSNLIKYSELFYSIQGEGALTGRATLWVRLFKCNLQCSGFGQIDPTDSETWDIPHKRFDVNSVTRVEDLPVFERGCDTPYSWDARFKSLIHSKTAQEICDLLINKITNEYNPQGKFQRLNEPYCYDTREIDLCFTGGEPLLSQQAIGDIVDELIERGNFPKIITFETNATQPLSEAFRFKLEQWRTEHGIRIFFSCSPKLWTVSGEKPEKAYKPEVIEQYACWSNNSGQLKYVMNGTQENWQELETQLKNLWRLGVKFPVYLMKVGATVEGQAGIIPGHDITEAEFVDQVLKRGYHYSGRIHVGIYGNVVGS